MSQTANLNLTLPTPNLSTDWGNTLNSDLTIIDSVFGPSGNGTSVGINIGSGKNAVIGGTLLLGSGDGTGGAASGAVRGPATTGTDQAGKAILIQAGNGTGVGGSGPITFQTAPPSVSSSDPNVYKNAMTLNKASSLVGGVSTYLVDIGPGGTDTSYAGATMRLNGSSAAGSLNGGSGIFFAQNSANVGAIGQSSTLNPASLVGNDALSVWSASNIRFFAGSTVTGANERFRITLDGALGVFDGAGNVSYGTTGQVLSSQGNNLPAKWIDAGGGGGSGWVVVGSQLTANSTPYINKLTGLDSYRAIRLTLTNIRPDTDGANFFVQVAVSGSAVTTGYSGIVTTQTPGAQTIGGTAAGNAAVASAVGNGTADGTVSGTILITNFGIARKPGITSNLIYGASGGTFRATVSNVFQADGSINTGFRLGVSTGNIVGGTVLVEGLA